MNSPTPIRYRGTRRRANRSYLHVVPTLQPPTLPIGLTGRQQDVWLEVAAGHASAAEINVRLDLRMAKVDATLAELCEAGHLRLTDWVRGRYQITAG